MTTRTPCNVLFLCTGNSARSILGEAILNRLGEGRFKAFSAGSFPKGAVNPHALALLRRLDYPTAALRSKSWDEFAQPQSPALDVIITVCDNAAGEVCPVWPGKPVTAHWGLPDPAETKGADAEIARAFEETHAALTRRIEAFLDLPFENLDAQALRQRVRKIGLPSEAERNKALVRRLYEETDKANIAIIDELFAPGFVNHQAGVTGKSAGNSSIENLKRVWRLFEAGFPDTTHVIEYMAADGDMVAARVSATGTHTGDMLGAKATGRRVTMTGTVAYRFRDGKIVERWADEDRLGFYQQLGVVTLPDPARYR